MTMHTSYKVSKALKEFLGESAPEPMEEYFWWPEDSTHPYPEMRKGEAWSGESYPAYQLHDLLSKPFLDAFTDKRSPDDCDGMDAYTSIIVEAYQDGGIPAVETGLCRMMEGR
jgi:hypothetical protein